MVFGKQPKIPPNSKHHLFQTPLGVGPTQNAVVRAKRAPPRFAYSPPHAKWCLKYVVFGIWRDFYVFSKHHYCPTPLGSVFDLCKDFLAHGTTFSDIFQISRITLFSGCNLWKLIFEISCFSTGTLISPAHRPPRNCFRSFPVYLYPNRRFPVS